MSEDVFTFPKNDSSVTVLEKSLEEFSDEETDFQEMNLSEKQGYQRVKHNTAQCTEDSENEEILRRKMKFFFMNPMEKYLASKQMPWKLGLQILKVLLVTTQLLIFAGNYQIINYWSLV